jgi:hypothetical protein
MQSRVMTLLLFYGVVVVLSYVAIIEATILLTKDINKPLNRSSFPDDFIFGSASSAYQVLQIFQYSFTIICINKDKIIYI